MAYKASLAQETMLADLRDYQKKTGRSLADVEEELGWGYGKLSRALRGLISISLKDLNALMEIYDVPAREKARLRMLRTQSRAKALWWDAYSSWIPKDFEKYIALEDAAQEIVSVHSSVFPGLFQLPAYTRALFESNGDNPPAGSMFEWLEVRARRQQILTKRNAPKVTAVVTENVMYQGKPDIMAQQLDHVLELLKLPNVDLVMLPSVSMVIATSLDMVRLPSGVEAAATEVHLLGTLLLDDRSQIRRTKELIAFYRANALDSEETAEMIRRRRGDLA